LARESAFLPLAAAALTAAATLTVYAMEGFGLVPAVHAARWTARAMLPFVVAAFVVLGRSFDAPAHVRQALCRAAAVSHAIHLAAVTAVIALEPPEARAGLGLLTELGGGGAGAVIVAGWWLWDRGWYRWATYVPWGVLAFTYLFLTRLGDSAPRITASPAVFGPVLAALLAALLVRVWSDLSGGMRRPGGRGLRATGAA
jgi:hypothetical protein